MILKREGAWFPLERAPTASARDAGGPGSMPDLRSYMSVEAWDPQWEEPGLACCEPFMSCSHRSSEAHRFMFFVAAWIARVIVARRRGSCWPRAASRTGRRWGGVKAISTSWACCRRGAGSRCGCADPTARCGRKRDGMDRSGTRRQFLPTTQRAGGRNSLGFRTVGWTGRGDRSVTIIYILEQCQTRTIVCCVSRLQKALGEFL